MDSSRNTHSFLRMANISENLVDEPPDSTHNLNLIDNSDWSPNNEVSTSTSNNSTLLYIAVEYVSKADYKLDPEGSLSRDEGFTDFQQHVSPLDPNMSSVARYSPVYNEQSDGFSPIVIHQLVTSTSNEPENGQFVNNLHSNSSLEAIPTVLCNNNSGVDSQYLQMVNESDIVNGSESNVQSIQNEEIHRLPKNEQEVEILITDQATGISYSVSTQELLVERCLEDERLLDVLAPDPLLDSELLAIDESTLKNNLPEDLINGTVASVDSNVVNGFMSGYTTTHLIKNEYESEEFKLETRRRRQQNDIESEDQLLSQVYSIIDKPILSRARASLPESYLAITGVSEEFGVFAKKCIPKRTQFGPITGILKNREDVLIASNKLELLIADDNGVVGLDILDEEESNWMCFVRKAENYQEQNLLVSQNDCSLFFTATRNILPSQELKVGYSKSYATQHNFAILEEEVENSWPCFECAEQFSTSQDLQNHLNVHDDRRKDENIKPRKKFWKNKRRISKIAPTEALQCNICGQVFVPPKYSILRHHFSSKHKMDDCSVKDNFSVVRNYKCEKCNIVFNSDALYRIHNLLHNSEDNSDTQIYHICPSCHRKFPTQRQLILHVSTHSLPKIKMIPERFQCPVCYNCYPLRERLQRHMLVHGPEDSKPLQCKTCKKRFMNNSALTCHVKTHFIGKNIYECPICKESFEHVLKLKLHVPMHCVNNSYACPHCSKVFKAYSIIRKHIRAFHSDRKHSCPHCTKHFPTIDKLRMHLLRHSDHREFLCADCGKQFKRKDKLKEHCKRLHSEERENNVPKPKSASPPAKKFTPKVEPTDFHRFIYKCHACMVGFKRRGMLVNHLAKRHPDISPESVPELNLPILRTTRDYYCQYCDKVYKSSSKRKAHILKNHPGAALPMSNRRQGAYPEVSGLPNPTFSQTVGSVTTHPQNCTWCHKQYASKAKLLQHQRKEHLERLDQHCDDKKIKTEENMEQAEAGPKQAAAYKGEFGVTEQILTNGMDEFVDDPEPNTQYCHLVAVNDDEHFQQTNLTTPNSHLYRLLTTSNSLVPPR